MSALQDKDDTNPEPTAEGTTFNMDSPANDPSASDIPRISGAEALDETELQDTVNLLRRFHLGEPTAIASTSTPDTSTLPLLLNQFRRLRRFRYEYPLLLSPAEKGELVAKSLEEFLKEALESDTSSKLLEDNIAWLETHTRDQLTGQDRVTSAREILAESGLALQEQIDLDESSRESLQASIDALVESIPIGSYVLPYGPNVALHLLQHKIRQRTQWQREQLIRRVEKAVRGLQKLVRVEEEKNTDGQIIGAGSQFFNNSSMADVLNHRGTGSVTMEEVRLNRVNSIIDVLSKFKIDENALHMVVRPDSFSMDDASLINIIESSDPCMKAIEIYDEAAGRLSQVFASLRAAELEIADNYSEKFHDSWFENFDVDAFSDEEKQMIPTVVAFESAERVITDGMQSFSVTLGSGRPIQVLINVDPNASANQLLGRQRLELASLGIGHRHAIVNQISAGRVESLMSGFSSALGSHKASLHLINTGFTDPQPLHPWIMASAALESRAHPFIKYDPSGDVTFSGNPCPETDWAVNPATYTNEQDELVECEQPFTFADYCLLKPELHDHYRVVPDGCDSDELVQIDEYLNGSEDSQGHKVPFVWAVDPGGLMSKLVVSRSLILATRDRLNFWHSLQSLAGINNIFVEAAVEKSREEERQLAAAERETLTKEHEETLEQVRSESTSEVMGRLTNVLLGLDLSSDATIAPAAAPELNQAPPATEAVEAETVETPEAEVEAPEPVVEDDDDISFDEPWIDSIFCTTCDDCLALNKQMFVYNDNRQAIISDPKLGTYQQLVEAAELCPARCIHPGKPLNGDESGLDDLIARAEPYN